MSKPKPSIALKKILLRKFLFWAEPQIKLYEEPPRTRRLKGEKVGLSLTKYYCALLQTLYGPFSLAELSKASSLKLRWVEIAGASPAMIKQWRTEEEFLKVANKASRDFVDYLLYDLSHFFHDDQIMSILWTEALIFLPGFSITDNLLIDKINQLVQEGKTKDPGEDFFENIEDYLVAYANIVDMMHEYTTGNNIINLESEVYNIINPIRIDVEILMNKAIENKVISKDVKAIFDDIFIFLMKDKLK